MRVLVPIEITEARLVSSTAVEPGPGEFAWDSTKAYAVNDQCYSPVTHRRYQAAVAHTNRNPATDTVFPAAWADIGPTNRWAALDNDTSTQTVATGSLTIVLKPGFFTSIALFGLAGAHLSITVQETEGGTVIYSYSAPLDASRPGNWWQYYFGGFKPQTDFVASGIEPYFGAVATITITGPSQVKVGVIALGTIRALGETQFGAKSRRRNYTRIVTDTFGNTTIRRGRSGRDLSITAWLKLADAPAIEDALEELDGVPCVWFASELPLYRGLRTFGTGNGEISYDHPKDCLLTLDVMGLVNVTKG